MFNILNLINVKKKTTGSGWVSFNCPCCVYRGHRTDNRMRGGLKIDPNGNWVYNCFNCNYSCNYIIGKPLSGKTRQFLSWIGMDAVEIQKLNIESIKHRDLLDISTQTPIENIPSFKDKEIPDGELLDINNRDHSEYIHYLEKRCISPTEYPFIVTPNERGRNNNRIIIPYTYKNRIVGHTSRYLDGKTPKYINDQQTGYVFGYDFQQQDWAMCIVVEGIFDALSIGACAVMHNTISTEQAKLINSLNRQIIVVPDRDKAGLEICERALELGYKISIPNWHPEIKDVNDAVVKYGKFPTLLSIIQCATSSKIKIEMNRRKLID